MPIQRTVEWLCKAVNDLPKDIRMIYIDSGEYVSPAPDHRTVARYDLFGFKQIPSGRFDPQNKDHVGDLGKWDFEAHPTCDFPNLPFDDFNWLEVLECAVRNSNVSESLKRRNVLLLFADHDGPITVLDH